jgi:hypothetical protein
MALTITGKLMRSPDTGHGAVLDPDANFRPHGPEVWRVTWLPGRALTRGQAPSAMMIAQAAGRLPAGADPEDCSDVLDSRGLLGGRPRPLGACPPWCVRLNRPRPNQRRRQDSDRTRALPPRRGAGGESGRVRQLAGWRPMGRCRPGARDACARGGYRARRRQPC